MLLCMSVLATVLRMLSFLFAAEVVFWMCLEKLRYGSNVRPRIFGVLLKGMGMLFSRTCGWVLDFFFLLKGMGMLFSRTCGWVLDICLSVVMRVMEDLFGDAVIRFSTSQVWICVR